MNWFFARRNYKPIKHICVCFQKAKVKDVSVQTDNLADSEPKDIIEDIKEAAELATQNTGFVYDEHTGMYYDSNTGYYYNAVFTIIFKFFLIFLIIFNRNMDCIMNPLRAFTDLTSKTPILMNFILKFPYLHKKIVMASKRRANEKRKKWMNRK